MMVNVGNHDILTLKEACALLRVTESTLRRWLERGYIPGHKIGGVWRFNREELIEWLKQQ